MAPAQPEPPTGQHPCARPPPGRKSGASQRAGTVGARPPRAAQPERAGQEGRRPAERAAPDRDDLRQQGFASIDPADLRGRFRWWGLYTQRKPGIDGGKTAILEPEELDDEYFMLRVRIDGGQLTWRSCGSSAEISTEYARDTADITDRQNIQLHWIRIEDVPEIWRRLEAVGLQTTEACGDTPRVVLGSPVAGIAPTRSSTGRPAIDEIVAPLRRRPGVLEPAAQVQDRDLGCPPDTAVRDQRHRVRRRGAPRARPGLRPLGRRRPVDQPDARPAASARGCRWPRCADVWAGVSGSSATTATAGCAPGRGSSSSSPTGARRSSARSWRRSTSGERCSTARRPPPPRRRRDHVGVHRRGTASYYVGVAPGWAGLRRPS